jgi:hypothetical protein
MACDLFARRQDFHHFLVGGVGFRRAGKYKRCSGADAVPHNKAAP